MTQHQFGVIGAGNMAEALLRGALAANVIHHNTVIASDPVFARRQHFTRELGVTSVEDNTVPAACPRMLLAVKPQVMPEVLDGIASNEQLTDRLRRLVLFVEARRPAG